MQQRSGLPYRRRREGINIGSDKPIGAIQRIYAHDMLGQRNGVAHRNIARGGFIFETAGHTRLRGHIFRKHSPQAIRSLPHRQPAAVESMCTLPYPLPHRPARPQ